MLAQATVELAFGILAELSVTQAVGDRKEKSIIVHMILREMVVWNGT